MHHKISVIIPCYNGEAFVKDAVESVLSQPLARAGDVEILVVNDGSTDGTAEVIRSLAARPSVKFFDVPNGGAAKARNLAMGFADGTWIMFLDADDLFLTDVLDESFGTALDAYAVSGVDVIRTPWVAAGGGMAVIGDFMIMSARSLTAEDHHLYSTSFASCVYRRAFVEANGIRFLSYSRMDVETSFRYLAFAYSESTVIDNRMMFYVCRDNGESSTHRCNDYVIDRTRALAYCELRMMTPCPDDREFLLEMSFAALWNYWLDSVRRGGNDLNSEMRRLLSRIVSADGSWALRLKAAALAVVWPLSRVRLMRIDDSRSNSARSMRMSNVLPRLAILADRVRRENSALIATSGVDRPYLQKRNLCKWS